MKVFRNLKQIFPDERANSLRFTKPSTIDHNKRVMFIPASSIAKFKSSVDANNVTNKILSLPETLDSLPLCKIDVNIANKLMDESVDIVLPKLSSFELNSLNFDLRYTTDALFDLMMKYLAEAPDRQLQELTLHIFSQSQFEETLRVITNMQKDLQKLTLVLY